MRLFALNLWLESTRATCPRNASSEIDRAGNFWRSLAVFAVMATLAPLAAAQRSVPSAHTSPPAHSATAHFNPPNGSLALGRNAHPARFRRSHNVSPYASLPFPFFGDSFNPDDIYSTGYPVASQPPAFLMQALQGMTGSATNSLGSAMGPLNDREPSSSQPLMIELQNGRYVHVKSAAADGDAQPLHLASNPTRMNSTQPPVIDAASPSQTLPPAVLVFRDGHSEEVRDYTIADGMLYARGDYYTDGYWTKKIDLATLNVPGTLQANATRNVNFVLPSSPNEVITRP